MAKLSHLSWYRKSGEIPAEIYIPLVDSLYTERGVLFTGALTVSLAVLLSAFRTGSALLYGLWIALVAIAVLRAIDMHIYVKLRSTINTVARARHWETRYVVGAAAFMGGLGVWCVIVYASTDDPYVLTLSITATIAYMIGISGRNFGSARLVATIILVDGVLVVAALLMPSDLYYALSAFLVGGFFVSFKFISDRLRKTLLDAVISAREISILASRFDTALNNMPHGLCMFDANRRVVVTNRRFRELLGLSDDAENKGETVRELAIDCVEAGTILRTELDRLANDIDLRLRGEERKGFTLDRRDGRTLDLTFQSMENGGSVVLIEDITERKSAEARISHLARYDGLTGLPNRVHLRERMEDALAAAGSQPVAVMFVDLDQFKQVNDTLGHPRGDVLLRLVAERLRRVVRTSDIVARFGGDEFVIVQSPIAGPDEAAALARRVVTSLSETYDVDGHQVVIGASVGIAMSPRDAIGPDHLLKIADMALYWAKSDQRGSWRFFEPDMDIRAHARRTLELDLRHALANNSFQLFYQPLFDLKSKRVSTCEALLRWPHPLRGMISPAEFIPVAEEMGLIVELGKWVLREACRTALTWPAGVRVAVNLSAAQFGRGDVVDTVRDALQESGLEASRLELEITESVLFQNTRAAQAILHRLRDLGVRISLDDFGTGYSSLSYLQSLPLNKVKIDRSFLEGIEAGERAQVLLRGIAQLSADLGLQVTVEGIETPEQLALVSSDDNITEAQGWVFAPALPAKEVSLLLERSALPRLVERVA
jgi:diguanylate cyclase (GGDEF)-like protein/PAS domain S-box-containing protein